MEEKQIEYLEMIRNSTKEATEISTHYWKEYSGIDSVQFWIVLLVLIIPLIFLYLKIDRKKMFLLGFFGLNYHIWFAYANSGGIRLGKWEYPYELIPMMPSFSLDASLIPVCYMFVYQWVLNHQKNYYLYALCLSAFFAFIMKPILVYFHFFHMFGSVNYFTLFLYYIGIAILAKIVTNIFGRMQQIET